MAKRKTVMVGSVPYTMADLRAALRAANDEARGYLDTLQPLRDENRRLKDQLDAYKSARAVILEVLHGQPKP